MASLITTSSPLLESTPSAVSELVEDVFCGDFCDWPSSETKVPKRSVLCC